MNVESPPQTIFLPDMLNKYFWDCDFEALRMSDYAFFITERILNFGNMQSVKWLLTHIDTAFLMEVLETSRNLDQKTRNYWKTILW